MLSQLGSEDYHKAVGSKIVHVIEQGPSGILQHIKGTKINIAKTFLSIITDPASILVKFMIICFNLLLLLYWYNTRWNRYSPRNFGRGISSKAGSTAHAIVYHQGDHYEAEGRHVEVI